MKIGISFVSIAQARQNLAAEIPGFDFDAVHAAAKLLESLGHEVVEATPSFDGRLMARYNLTNFRIESKSLCLFCCCPCARRARNREQQRMRKDEGG